MCVLVFGIAFSQVCFDGSQVLAQPIFRAPRQSLPVQQPGLQLTGPRDSIMAPIQAVGSGDISSSRFQLPQTEKAHEFFPPNSFSNQSEQSRDQFHGRERKRVPALREVSADGSFLPVDRVEASDTGQADATFDLPGLDLSALGLDIQEQHGDDGRSSSANGDEFEQLPLSLEQMDLPQRRTDNVRREQVVENYSDGRPRLLRTVALDREGNYYNDGPWVVKDRDGKVVAAGTYRKGVMQGQWARRHTSADGGMFTEKPFTLFQGPFDSITNFKAGKLDGQWIIYDRAKRSIIEIGYKDGIRDGLATWFYPDTTKMRQVTFKQGTLDGEVVEWDEDGRMVSKEFYRDGRKLIRNTSFYRPKVLKEESYFLDVKLKQNGLDNWWDAKPAPYLSSGERVQNGQARGWYSNRQLQYQGQFRNDKPIGRFFWWHENGNRSTVGQFNRTGDRYGRWIWWHDNGMKRIEGEFEDDRPSGVWRSWDKAGKLIKDKDYNNLDAEEIDDRVDLLGVPDDDSVEGLLEDTTESEPGNQFLPSVMGSDDQPKPAIGSGLINEDGFLPLPQDASGSEPLKKLDRESVPLSQQSFESLPPALEEESFDDEKQVDETLGGKFANEFSGIQHRFSDGADEEITVIESGVVDDAVEAFDLGELFE